MCSVNEPPPFQVCLIQSIVLPHGFSPDPCFYLIDLRLNILEIIGFTEKSDADVREEETRVAYFPFPGSIQFLLY